MAIMRKLINGKKQKEMFSLHVRKGYVPVMVGGDEFKGVRERFLIPTHFMSHPVIVSLLESSADEFGYRQEGVLQIPADPDCFREIVRSLLQ